MKSNVALQASLNLSHASQKVWYAANVLRAACTSSPAVLVRAAVPAVVAKPAIIAQTAKLARTASLPVPAANNTTGFGFGEIYLNSPAYPAGTAIPAITAKPASLAVVGVDAVLPVPAITAVSSPAVVALPDQQNTVMIDRTVPGVIGITVKFPRNTGVGIVGSQAKRIKEFTPSTLQASAWIDGICSNGAIYALGGDLPTETLEEYLYRNIKLLPSHTETIIGGDLVCTATIYTTNVFNPSADSIQLDYIRDEPANSGS